MKWTREFDGGRYTSADGRIVIILKDGSGKFSHMRRYAVKVDGVEVGAPAKLADAKALGIEKRDNFCQHRVSTNAWCPLCQDVKDAAS